MRVRTVPPSIAGKITTALFSLIAAGLLLISCTAKEPVVLEYVENDSLKSADFAGAVTEINTLFMKQNPGITINMQSYKDEEIPGNLELMAASNSFPDVLKYWSTAEFMTPYLARGDFLELDLEKYKSNDYIVGALESNIYNGKLYGIPDTCDFIVMFYNKRLLDQAGVQPPATFEDLFKAADALNAQGIIPVVTGLSDGWGTMLLMDALIGRFDSDFRAIGDVATGKIAYADSSYLKAAELFDQMIKRGVFPRNVLAINYQSSAELFRHQKAAMTITGSWGMSLAHDTRYSAELRDNLRAMKIPAVTSGRGSVNNTAAWFGGNHVVYAKTKHKKEALLFLDFISKNRSRIVWQGRNTVISQYVSPTPDDHPMVVDLLSIIRDSKVTSGNSLIGRLPLEFRDKYGFLLAQLASQAITPKELAARTDALLKEVR